MMQKLFSIGDVINGYCNGYFGRDDYYEKICVMVTNRYAVFQYLNGEWKGQAVVLNYDESLEELIAEWKID
jgi:hypothetical protein